jgi:hypothetical protein
MATVAAEGPGHRLRFYWQANGTTPWHREAVAGSGTTFSAPGVAYLTTDHLIAAAGPGRRLLFYWQPDSSAAWHPERVAPPGSIA